ncbi:S-layer protein, partial [Bacillus thuringiensis]|nr:S-layer protein [Bacillus thuringiensis]
SYNGKTYTANLKADTENATITAAGSTTAVKPAELAAGVAYTVTDNDVSFNIGSENAGKTVTLGSANTNVKLTGTNSDNQTETNVYTLKVKLDQNGVASLTNVAIANVYAINTTDNSNV